MAIESVAQEPRTSAVRCVAKWYTDEFRALAVEISNAEGLSQIEAFSTALSMVDELAAYAMLWDSMAFRAGNDDACPF